MLKGNEEHSKIGEEQVTGSEEDTEATHEEDDDQEEEDVIPNLKQMMTVV